jgi:hypothetical protein
VVDQIGFDRPLDAIDLVGRIGAAAKHPTTLILAA